MFETIFISDLHLDRQDSAKNRLFIKACDFFADNCQKLYILGDFWESWLGDDSLDYADWQSGFGQVAKALAKLGEHIPILFMVGNRDFTVGKDFYQKCNLQKISDPEIINLNNKNIMLSHGDYLCIDNKAHIETSKIIRNPQFIANFIKKSMIERIELLNQYERAENKDDDINIEYTTTQMKKYKVSILIHGHIHKPQKQSLGDHNIRYVLPNWDDQAGMLGYSSNSFELFDLIWKNDQVKPVKLQNPN